MTQFNYDRSLENIRARILDCSADSIRMSKMSALKSSLDDFRNMGSRGLDLACLAFESLATSMKVEVPTYKANDLESLARSVDELGDRIQKQVANHLVDLAEMRAYLSSQVKRTMSQAAYFQEKLDRGFEPQAGRFLDLREYDFCKLLCINGKLPSNMKDVPEIIKAQAFGLSATMRVLIQNTSEWIRIHRSMMLYSSKPIEEFCVRQVPTFSNAEVLPGGFQLESNFSTEMGTGNECLEKLFSSKWQISQIKSDQEVDDKVPVLSRTDLAESLDQVKRLSLVSAEIFDLFYKEVWSESQVMELLNDIRTLGNNPKVWPLFDLAQLQMHLLTQAATVFAKYICDFCEAYLSYLELSFEKD